MSRALAERHIVAQERLRAAAQVAVAATWARLPAYDEEQVDPWLLAVLPLVAGAQRQSAAMTAAYLARSVEGPPVGPTMDAVVGGAVRAGTPPATVYRRPFVTVWTALRDGTPYVDAVAAGRARATSTAAMDVQLAMRQTLVDVGERDPRILGYQRVPDADACAFCRLVAGQRYRTDQLMPLHNHCGCGVDVITEANRGDFTGKPENDLSVTGEDVTAAVEQHGELGPVLVDGAQNFTSL